VVNVDHLGEPIRLLGNPIKMSNSEEAYECPPELGEHTEEVLTSVLGYKQEALGKLRADKVIN